MIHALRTASIILAILLSGGLFGFFFTMQYSIMPGFDQTPAYSALISNQMIGRATQGSYFIVLLLGSPIMLIVSMALCAPKSARRLIPWLFAAVLAWGAMGATTMLLNVPLNQALDALPLSPDMKDAQVAWEAYSPDWQRWNLWRVAFSAISTLLAINSLVLANQR